MIEKALQSDIGLLLGFITILVGAISWLVTKLHSEAMSVMKETSKGVNQLKIQAAEDAADRFHLEKRVSNLEVSKQETRKSLHDFRDDMSGRVVSLELKKDAFKEELISITKKVDLQDARITMVHNSVHDAKNAIQKIQSKIENWKEVK